MSTRTVANLTAVISANNTKFKKGVKESNSVLSGFKKSVMGLGPAIAGAFAVGKLVSFGKEALALYDVQAKAEQQLLTALKGRENAQQRLIAQAQYLQKQTLFGDEETIRAQALIAAFVKEEDQIRRIIPLVQDLAAAKQMDLAGAADLVSKTLGSTTNALSRYGIQVEGAVGSTERLESLAAGLANAFGGQAEAMAKSGMGSVQQLQNAFADLKEEIGGVINMPLAKWAQNTADALNVAQDKGVKFGDKILGVFMPSVKMANRAIADMNDATAEFEIVGEDAAVSADDFAVSNQSVAKTAEEAAKAIEEQKKSLEDLNSALEDSMIQSRLYVQSLGDVGPVSTDSGFFGIDMSDIDMGEEILSEPETDALIARFDSIRASSKEMSDTMAVAFAQIGSSFAQSVGEIAAGTKSVEDALADLGAMILQALGDILITAGLGMTPVGVPLILAGLAMKGLGSFGAAGGFNPQPRVAEGYGFTQRGDSKIYGNDIKVANDYATNLYNRVG